MKIYIVAGEASGDVHGANLMKALLAIDEKIEFRFWGGDLMNNVYNGLEKHYRDLAFMGFVEVVQNLGTIRRNFNEVKKQILNFAPDKVIFIDYPGFNLRLAKWVKSKKIETHYYISPKVWSWNKSRVKKIKTSIDHMYVILPFEKAFYDNYDYPVNYIGNPILDEIHKFEKDKNFKAKYKFDDNQIVAVLPGSREQEIVRILPTMLEASQHYPELIFCVAVTSTIDEKLYKQALPTKHSRNIRFIKNDYYNLLAHARVAIVTSGTATLETALFDVPQVVCYKGNRLTVRIAKKLVNIKYISLVNLIVDKLIVKELIQEDFTKDKLVAELDLILGSKGEVIKKAYIELVDKIGEPGASERAAKLILEL